VAGAEACQNLPKEMGWFSPPRTALQCAKLRMFATQPQLGKNGEMNETMIGIDPAKNVFQVHGASMAGHLNFRKKLTRAKFWQFMASQASSLVVMDACGSASYWGREMLKLGHEVKLIAPQYSAVCKTPEERYGRRRNCCDPHLSSS